MEREAQIKLIQACRKGDPEALETLIREMQNPIYYQCRKMLGDEQDALDATQEVMLTVLNKLENLREPAAFWKWVHRITACYCQNQLTRGKKDLQFWEDEEGNSVLDQFEELDEQLVPDKAVDNEETRQMVVALVDALPPAQRLCVLMYYYDEMPVKEIAQALEVPENTVKSRLNYARKAIKEGVLGYERQGVKLYGLSPLPFLLYFLRQDAALCGLSQSASQALTQGVLSAAGVATGAAVGSGAAAGSAASAGAATAGSASASAAGGLLSAGVNGKAAALVLAGLVAVGGGGYLLTRPPEEPEPAPVVAVVTPSPSPELLPTPTLSAMPTPTPTPTPTVTPSSSPTVSPTVSPAVSPTLPPTPPPVATPSPSPTPPPTAAPVRTPTPAAPTPTPTPQPVQNDVGPGITLGQEIMVLSPNNSTSLSVVDTEGHRVTDGLVWENESPDLLSLNTSTQTLRSNGASGTGYINVSWNGYTSRMQVRVVPTADQINLSMLSSFCSPDTTQTVSLYVFDTSKFYGQDYTVSWSVDDPSVVRLLGETVSSKGYPSMRYTTLDYGDALITCRVTLPDGTYSEAFCSVYVYYDA